MITDMEKAERLEKVIDRSLNWMDELADFYADNPDYGPYSLEYGIVANCRMQLYDNLQLARKGNIVLGDAVFNFEEGIN